MTSRNGIREFMRLFKNIGIMAAIVMMAIIIMPQSVWAGATSISPKPINVTKGSTATCTITYELCDAAAVFTTETIESSNTSIATVNIDSKNTSGTTVTYNLTITGVAAGTCQLNASFADHLSDDSKSGTGGGYSDIVVTAPSRSLTLDKTSLNITADDTLKATAVNFTPASDITWSVDPAGVVSLTSSGTNKQDCAVAVVAPGTATITAVAVDEDGESYTATCLVKVSIPATDISLDNTTKTLDLSTATKTFDLTATLTPSNSNSAVSWTSSNSSVATVSTSTTSGAPHKITVTGLKAGTATITARAQDANGKTATCVVTVENPVTSVTINNTVPTTIAKNQEIELTSTVNPSSVDASSYTITYSATPSGATITGNKFKAATAGTYAVKATVVQNNVGGGTTTVDSATYNITVAAVAFNQHKDINITVGKELPLSAFFTLTPAIDSKINWSSISGASLSGNGTLLSASKISGTAENTSGQTLTAALTDDPTTTATSTVKIYKNMAIAYDSNKLKCTVPGAYYVSTDDTKNLASVSGGVLQVYYNGEKLYEYGSVSDQKEFDASSLQSIIGNSSIMDKIKSADKDQADLEFRMYLKGTTPGGSSYTTSDYVSTTVPVYKITVSGTGITTTKYYGVNGYSSLKITATPDSTHTFSKWSSDGSTTNPRTVTISGSATYTAEAASKSSSGSNSGSNSGSGSSSGSSKGSGSGAGYDKVPKTGEGNALMWMWILLAASIVVAGGAVFVALNPSIIEKLGSKKDKK